MLKSIKDMFGKAAGKVKSWFGPKPLHPSEQALIDWGFEYTKRSDGTFFVAGNMNISDKHLTKLPDFSNVVVEGNFSCLNNDLTSLEGAPKMFAALMSDFGVFWDGKIPEELRHPPVVVSAKAAAAPKSFDL